MIPLAKRFAGTSFCRCDGTIIMVGIIDLMAKCSLLAGEDRDPHCGSYGIKAHPYDSEMLWTVLSSKKKVQIPGPSEDGADVQYPSQHKG